MTEPSKPAIGTVVWQDLTVTDAAKTRDFYSAVVGWKSSAQSIGDYDDFNMLAPATGHTIAGICHARGSNANLPAAWLIYITVADVDQSAHRCVELGGKVLDGPRPLGSHRFCVIQDPAGAVAALIR